MDISAKIKELEILVEIKIQEYKQITDRLQKLKNIQAMANAMNDDEEVNQYVKSRLKDNKISGT